MNDTVLASLQALGIIVASLAAMFIPAGLVALIVSTLVR